MSTPAIAVSNLTSEEGTALSQQDIAKRAHAHWQQRGPGSSAEQNWSDAEQQLRNESDQTPIPSVRR